MITVEQLSDDGLSRKAWFFNFYGLELILRSYQEQTRQTKRHKWNGDGWRADAEREHWQINKHVRPTHIPPEVLEDAKKQAIDSVTVYIGWRNPSCLYQGKAGK